MTHLLMASILEGKNSTAAYQLTKFVKIMWSQNLEKTEMEYNWDLFKHQIYAFARHYELGLLKNLWNNQITFFPRLPFLIQYHILQE